MNLACDVISTPRCSLWHRVHRLLKTARPARPSVTSVANRKRLCSTELSAKTSPRFWPKPPSATLAASSPHSSAKSSCCARRMADSAAHLRDCVFPPVPARQWVFTLPKRLRFLLAWRPKLISLMLRLLLRALFAWQRRRKRRQGIHACDPARRCFLRRRRRAGAVSPTLASQVQRP